MKVAIYANTHSSGLSGGIETYLSALISALGKLHDGPEEYVLIGPEKRGEWLESVRGPNQTIVRVEACAASSSGFVPRLFERILSKAGDRSRNRRIGQGHTKWSKFTGPGDVVPLSSGFIEALDPAVIHFPYQEFVVTSIPSIYNPHDVQHLHLPQFFSPEVLMERELSYPFSCRMASKIAVCSNWIAQDLCEQYGLHRSKIAVIPWGAATSRFRAPNIADVQEVCAKYKLDGQYIFYPAVVWGHKNHLCLVEALKILKSRGRQIYLVLSGAGTQESDVLRNAINRAGMSHSVRVLGYVPSNDMRPLTRGALAVVVPSLFEAASGPIAEAWNDDTPVACSDIPTLREQADNAALFFNPRLPHSIADAVETLISDTALRERLVNAGRASLAKLSWARAAEQYRSLYREVALKSEKRMVSH
jgi:glycosyltransferase involved in cell wall biosynthesis